MKSLGDRFYNTLYNKTSNRLFSSSIHYRRLSLSNLPYHVGQRWFKSCLLSSSLHWQNLCLVVRKTRVLVHTFEEKHMRKKCARAKRAGFFSFFSPPPLPFIFPGTFYTSASSSSLSLSLLFF